MKKICVFIFMLFFLNLYSEDSLHTKIIVFGGNYIRIEDKVYYDSRKKIFVTDYDDSFEYIGGTYAKNKNYVFVFGEKMLQVDYSTFEYIDDGYAKDKDHVFIYEKIILNVDIETFKVVGYPYSKDKNHVYLYNKILEGENPNDSKYVGKIMTDKEMNELRLELEKKYWNIK